MEHSRRQLTLLVFPALRNYETRLDALKVSDVMNLFKYSLTNFFSTSYKTFLEMKHLKSPSENETLER